MMAPPPQPRLGHSPTAFALVAVTVACIVLAPRAEAGTLRGQVLDAVTGAPVPHATVRWLGHGVETATDSEGRYELHGASDVRDHELYVSVEGDEGLRYVHQTTDRESLLHIFASTPDPTHARRWSWGVPGPERPRGAEVPSDPIELPTGPAGPLALTISEPLPPTIRVGRRFASSCAGADVTRVDEVPFEEYVQGVLVPEIGVFRRVEGGPESARAVFEAFAVAARSYAFWFYLRNPDAEWHIDDTACNQRYDDARNAFIAEAVAATAGQIMVKAGATSTIDKFEYAASCGRHGSRPEYQDALVPDITGRVACVGTWCGHNNCAAHEVNPAVPDEGRCLVRGICQWGGVERSMRGDSYEEILDHYQPNLDLHGLPSELPARLVGFVRFDDLSDGEGVPGVRVAVDTGEETTTGDDGFYEFGDIEPGLRTLEFSGDAIRPATRTKEVAEGITNWASIVVAPPDVAEDVGVADPDPTDAGGETDGGTGDVHVRDVGDTGVVPDVATDTGAELRPDVGGDDAIADTAGETSTPDARLVDAAEAGGAGADAPSSSPEDAPIELGADRSDGGIAPKLFERVGPNGLGDTGCACRVSRSAPLGATHAGILLLGVILLRPRRRNAAPRVFNEGKQPR